MDMNMDNMVHMDVVMDYASDNIMHTNWLFDYGVMDDFSVTGGDFTVTDSPAFSWPSNGFTIGSPNCSVEVDGLIMDADTLKEIGPKKRSKPESCGAPGTKACREKLRRDKLNERFLELGAILEPGRPPKADKGAILSDAVKIVMQLRDEAQKLKESNSELREKIKELRAEKNELREEKQKLKSDKEKLEQQVNGMNGKPGYLPNLPAMHAAYASQRQAAGSKMMPVISYPGVAMWQFMPPATIDISQDHVLRPPVA